MHVVLIGSWVLGTLPPASMAEDSITNRVYYIPPPDRPPNPGGRGEGVRYVELARRGSAPLTSPPDAKPEATLREPKKAAADTAPRAADTVAQAPSTPNSDSVYTVLQVDTEVTRAANSAAPAYPLDLLKRGIEGSVRVRYVVDTTGFADTSSILILTSTNSEFTSAVLTALPYMRFHPARIGKLRVRQLVEQSFTFRMLKPQPQRPFGVSNLCLNYGARRCPLLRRGPWLSAQMSFARMSDTRCTGFARTLCSPARSF